MIELNLAFIAFFTSTITSIIGLGGGMMLIAFLPSFLPVNAIVPVHGLTQLSSNFSRAIFSYQNIEYSILPKFLLGSLLGIAIFASILSLLPLKYMPLFISFYILLSLWSKKFNKKIKKYENYFLIGFIQTGLSIVVGATGPLAMTLLLKQFGSNKDKVVSTAAALMSITHILKVLVFVYFGFVFFDYLGVIIAMIIASIFGSFIGLKLRNKIDGKKFVILVKILLTFLAFKIIFDVLFL